MEGKGQRSSCKRRKDPNQKRKATSFGGKKHWIAQIEPICKASNNRHRNLKLTFF